MKENHQEKYEEYNNWFDVIEGMCTDENQINIVSLIEGDIRNRTFGRYTHHVIEGNLHVFIKENRNHKIIKISNNDLSIEGERGYMSRHTSNDYCSIKLSTDESFGFIRYFPKLQNGKSIYNGFCYLPKRLYASSNAHEHLVSQIDMSEKLKQAIGIVQRGKIVDIYENAIALHDKIKQTVQNREKQLKETGKHEDTPKTKKQPGTRMHIQLKEPPKGQVSPESLAEENQRLSAELEHARAQLREALRQNERLQTCLTQNRRKGKAI